MAVYKGQPRPGATNDAMAGPDNKYTLVVGGQENNISRPFTGPEEFMEVFNSVPVRQIRLPASVASLDGLDFDANSGNLAVVDLSSTSVTQISDLPFNSCRSLKTVRFPAGLVEIGFAGFVGCVSLEAADLSGTQVTRIARDAFAHCRSLKTVRFPAGLVEIGFRGFWGCVSLEAVDLSVLDTLRSEDPQRALKIGAEAFAGCTSLSRLRFPSRMSSANGDEIGEGAFKRCPRLTTFDVSGLLEMDPVHKGNMVFDPRPDGTPLVDAIERDTLTALGAAMNRGIRLQQPAEPHSGAGGKRALPFLERDRFRLLLHYLQAAAATGGVADKPAPLEPPKARFANADGGRGGGPLLHGSSDHVLELVRPFVKGGEKKRGGQGPAKRAGFKNRFTSHV